MGEQRFVIIGAGPAGVRAAEALVEAGVRPVVINEGARDGGQIYRRQPEGFSRGYRKLYGTEAAKAEALHQSFERLRPSIDYRPETLAWNIWEGAVHIVSRGSTAVVPYDALIISSGASDRLMPVKGWEQAGCYSLGAAQIALKSQGCAIGRRVVFAGSGPLLYLAAKQYAAAGARVEAVLDTSPFLRRVSALPDLLAQPYALWNGVKLTAALARGGVVMKSGVTLVEITGAPESGVDGIIYETARGRRLRLDCDALALGWHVKPEAQLADLARCKFRFDSLTRQWLPEIDADGRSSVKGVYLAGDGARILGADGAEASGRLAALAALADFGHLGRGEDQARLRAELSRLARFQRGIARAFPWPHEAARALADDAVVCRCEGITAGELRGAARGLGARDVNRAKAFSRCGMGRCQGRYCGHAAAEITAAAGGAEIETAGRLRGQAPVKPLSIAAVSEDS